MISWQTMAQSAVTAALVLAAACSGADPATDPDAGPPDPDGAVPDGSPVRDATADTSEPDAFPMPPMPPPFGELCSAGEVTMADPGSGLIIGAWDEGASTVVGYVDDGPVEVAYGSQGGFMLQPELAVPQADFGTEPICLQVMLTHAFEGMPEVDYWDNRLGLMFRPRGDMLTSGVLNDQVGWGAPVGEVISLTVVARSADLAVQGQVLRMQLPGGT